MATRQNFSRSQRQSALAANALWLRDHRVDGIELALAFEPLRQSARVFYCENCLFCNSREECFDIDHLVADRYFRVAQKHLASRNPINMLVLCKSAAKGDFGCNQSKGAQMYVPPERGLAFTRQRDDMNCVPLRERPFSFSVSTA